MALENTKDVVADVGVLVKKILARAQDGVGADDLFALLSDEEFRKAALDIAGKAKSISGEFSAATTEQELELIAPIAGLVIEIVKSLKKPQSVK